MYQARFYLSVFYDIHAAMNKAVLPDIYFIEIFSGLNLQHIAAETIYDDRTDDFPF